MLRGDPIHCFYYASSNSQDSESSSKNSGFKNLKIDDTCLICSSRPLKDMNLQIPDKGGDNFENVGRLTSIITFSRFSSGATK